MNALFVLPPKRESDRLKTSDHYGTPAMRATVEQEFYNIHGTQSAARLLRFLTWVDRRLTPREVVL